MSRTYCHTHSKYDCPTCADEILSLGIQADKDRIKWLESEVARLQAIAARTVPEGFVMVPVEILQLIQCDVENSADWLSSSTSALRKLLPAAPEGKK